MLEKMIKVIESTYNELLKENNCTWCFEVEMSDNVQIAWTNLIDGSEDELEALVQKTLERRFAE